MKRWVALLVALVVAGVSIYTGLRLSGVLAPPVTEVEVFTPPYEWRSVIKVDIGRFAQLCSSGEIAQIFIERHGETYITIEYFGISADAGEIYRASLDVGGSYNFKASVGEKEHPIVVRWIKPEQSSLSGWVFFSIVFGVVAGCFAFGATMAFYEEQSKST